MRIIQPISISEQLLYSTVKINGDKGCGTGFFFRSFIEDDKAIDLILTNKHVIEGNKKLNFYFHEGFTNKDSFEPSGISFNVDIENFDDIWFPHPEEGVDLGALLLTPIKKHIDPKEGGPLILRAMYIK